MVAEKLAKFREKVSRREKKIRADRQARARRIEMGDPDSFGETAAVKARRAKSGAKSTVSEAQGLAKDTTQLVSTKLGGSKTESDGFVSSAGDALDGLNLDVAEDNGEADVFGGDLDLGGGADDTIEAVDMDGGESSDEMFDPFDEDDPL